MTTCFTLSLRAIALLVTMLAISLAPAADAREKWYLVDKAADGTRFYIDMGSIQRQGFTVNYSLKSVLKGSAYTILRVTGDCRNTEITYLGSAQYDKDKNLLNLSDAHTNDVAIPGTPSMKAKFIACGRE